MEVVRLKAWVKSVPSQGQEVFECFLKLVAKGLYERFARTRCIWYVAVKGCPWLLSWKLLLNKSFFANNHVDLSSSSYSEPARTLAPLPPFVFTVTGGAVGKRPAQASEKLF